MSTTGSFLIRATVTAAGTDTPYVRLGRGPVVLLLALDESLVEPLAADHRVVAPVLGNAPSPALLGDFLDGLGVTSCSVVAEAPFAGPALDFALRQPARVESLVLVGAEPEEADDAAMRLALEGIPMAVLVGPAATAERIARFVGGRVG